MNAFGDDEASKTAALRLQDGPKVKALGKAVAEIDNVMRELALNFDLAKLTA